MRAVAALLSIPGADKHPQLNEFVTQVLLKIKRQLINNLEFSCAQIKSTPDLASLFESIQKDSGEASSNGMDLSWGGGRRGAGRGENNFKDSLWIFIVQVPLFSGEASGSVCGLGGVKRKRADSGNMMEVDHNHHPGPQRPSKKWWTKILWFCYLNHLEGCDGLSWDFLKMWIFNSCNFILVLLWSLSQWWLIRNSDGTSYPANNM